MESKRLFLAIQPPAEICARLASVVREAMQTAERMPHGRIPIRLVAEQNLHLTLQFLGDTTVETIGRIEHALAPRLAECRRVHLEVVRFGCFPSPRRPRVVWAGLSDKSFCDKTLSETGSTIAATQDFGGTEARLDGLLGVYTEVCTGLARCGLACESRPFQAHITVGYVRRGTANPTQPVQSFLECANGALPPASRIGFDAVEVALVESRLSPAGAEYRNLAVLPLQCA